MNNNLMLTGKIGKLIFKLSVPMIIAQLINLLYNIVDRIYIGNYKDVGLTAIGGVGACFPIIIIISAFAALFGMGGAPYAAIFLGSKDYRKAEHTLNMSFVLLMLIAVIIMPILYIFKEDILYAFGANSQNIIYANDYINIYISGTIFVMISLGLSQYITSQGKTMFAMVSVIIGAVMNIILDPIFIYSFDMGVKGAALATIISQACSALFILIILRSKYSEIKIKPFKYKPDFEIIKSIIMLGMSPFIMQSTEALVQICFNIQIKNYITDLDMQTLYLSSMTILISIMSLISMPLQGLAQGTQPLISQNYGAGNTQRTRDASRKLILFSVIFSMAFVIILYLFPTIFVKLFNSDESLVKLSVKLIRIFFIGMALMGIQIGCQYSFLALGQSKISLLLASLRKIILLIPLTFILPLFLGSNGIFIAETVADIISIFVTLICYIILFKGYLKEKTSTN